MFKADEICKQCKSELISLIRPETELCDDCIEWNRRNICVSCGNEKENGLCMACWENEPY